MSSEPGYTDAPPGARGPEGSDGPAGPSTTGRRAASRPRAGSGLIARLLTVVYALPATVLATALISYGGSSWMQFISARGYMAPDVLDVLTGPFGMKILVGVGGGILLLVSVALTGIASSAGLLSIGLLSLVSLALCAVPTVLLSVYGAIPTSLVPFEVKDGIVYGLPLLLHTVLGGLGLGLMLTRRRPDPHVAVSVLGLLVVPIVLLAGVVLTWGGIGHGALTVARTADRHFSPLVAVLLVLAALLVWLGAAASRWSPYSLIIPALALLGATTVASLPEILPESWRLWSNPTGMAAITFLLLGGVTALAVILLVHTAVQAIVRRRARRLRGAGPVPPAASPPAAGADWSTGPA